MSDANRSSDGQLKRGRWPALSDEQYNAQWIERVKARCIVDPFTGCWIWQGYRQKFRNQKPGQPGYGGTTYRSKGVRIHRKMLEIKLGRILPVDIHSCHKCDVPPCANPEHLYPGTNQQNHIDGGKRGRMNGQSKTHCKHGHEFTPENTYWSNRKTVNDVVGKIRNCKECNRIRLRREWADGRGLRRQRRWREAQKAKRQQVSI